MYYPQFICGLLPSARTKLSTWRAFGIAAFLAGCTTVPPVTPVIDHEQRYQFRGFSVLPPKGDGWHLLSSSGSGMPGGAFGKQTRVSTHTVRAIVSSVDMKGKRFISPQDYGQYVEQMYRNHTSSSRFKIIELKHAQDTQLGDYCVRLDALVEDHGVPGFAGSVFHMISQDLSCIHPDYPDLSVRVGYSQRAASMTDFIRLHPEVEPFMQSLRFNAIP